jgi:ElaB/YqjD/DUF883 family membrane-anchored ribosome-binding protein
MRNRAAALGEDIQDNLEDLIESFEALLEDLKDQRGTAAEKLRTRAWATVKSARRRLADLRPEMGDLAAKTMRGTVKFVRRDPWRAVAIGALVIVAAGVLASVARSDDY